MKKIAIILSVLTLFIGCTPTVKKEKVKKPIITVTIQPQKFFIEQLAGDFFQVNVILPPGASAHEFEPTPKQIKKLSGSAIYFYVGHLGFEKSWMKKFAESAPDVVYVSCSKKIDLLRGDEDIHKSGDETLKHGTDPHIWTSPENVKTMSTTMCEELSIKFPEQRATFEANLAKFILQINTLDTEIRATLSDSLHRSFMIFHPALGYYARDYHLTQYSIEYEGKTPSTAHMKNMIDIARKDNISTIFIQAQFETAKAEAIAKELNAEIVTIDPLAENWLEEMYSLTQKMDKALSPKKLAASE